MGTIRKSKYGRNNKPLKTKPKTETQTTSMESSNENTDKTNTEETHENFVKAAEQSVKSDNKVTLETPNEAFSNPHSSAKIHRDYALDGITNKPQTEGEPKAQSNSTETPPPPPVDDEFVATPPDPSDAPEAKGHASENPGEPINAEPFEIPSGSAEELIEAGAKALNYLIDQYGDTLLGIKIRKEYFYAPDVVPQIKEQNQRNNERIKLSPTEIGMLKKPLVKLMQEKGIRGLTPGEELAAVVVIILVGKIKVVVDIRRENKMLVDSFSKKIDELIAAINKNSAKQDQTKGSVKRDIPDSEIPLTEAEELK